MDYFQILLPALLAGLLVVLTHVPLGIEVLRRGIVFIDLALAQTAALGSVVFSSVFFHKIGDPHDHATSGLSYLGAYGAAILCASLFYLVRNAPSKIQEALIGSVFVLSASVSILVLSNHPQGGEYLKDILVGQILWVQWSDLLLASGITIAVVLGMLLFFIKRLQFIFYPTFAIAVTLATQLVGVYLVFASLIIPALAGYGSKKPILVGYLTGVIGYVCGLWLSVLIDSPSGSVVVVAISAAGMVVWLLKFFSSLMFEK